ncbi:MAG: PIN domain-containing protein [Thermodesulfovibrionia bacterium]|nr:PIN domain-containing protein [Thermodesulfovibrionia bacterium]
MEEKNKGILADTSVWIEFFKLESLTGKKLESLIIKNSIWTCGVILFELLQGVRSGDEKALILEALSDMKYMEMTQPHWKKAAELSALLKRKGLNLPQSDIFIASIAIEHNLSVFTLDKHFEQIPGVRIYKA